MATIMKQYNGYMAPLKIQFQNMVNHKQLKEHHLPVVTQ